MTQRIEARMAGIAYLSYIVFTMSSTILFAVATSGDDIVHRAATLTRMLPIARFTVLLDLLQPICALVLAVTLYQLVKAVNPTLALLALLFRTGEGLLGSLPLLTKLELLRLVTSPSDAANLAVANQLLHRPDAGFSEFCFVVGGFLFALLFLQGRRLPLWLAWTGVITIGAQLLCVPLHIAGIVPGSVVNALWLPILLYEVPLGIWLILRGTNEPQLTAAYPGASS